VSPLRPFVKLTPTEHGTDIAADSMDLGVRATVESWAPLDAAEDEGEVGVAFKPLFDLISRTDAEDVELIEDPENLTLQIKAGRTDMALPTVDMDWFPHRVQAEGTAIKLSADDWSFVQTLIPFCSRLADTGVDMGLWFGPFGVVGTDGKHLGCWKHPFDQTAVVPGAVLAALRSDGDVVITVGERACTVEAEGLSVTTATIQGEPKDYTRLITEPTATIIADRAGLKEAMARVAISSRQSFTAGRQMQLESVDDRSIRLTSLPGEKTDGEVTEVFDCEVDGEIEPCGIDNVLLGNCMDLVGTDEVTIQYAGPNRALIIASDVVDAFVQPVRVVL